MSEKQPNFKNDMELNPLIPTEATDIQLVTFLIEHIENPCTVDVGNEQEKDIRDIRYFYIEEAKKALEKITNPYAKELLEKEIEKYNK